jgi:hypothetical protein
MGSLLYPDGTCRSVGKTRRPRLTGSKLKLSLGGVCSWLVSSEQAAVSDAGVAGFFDLSGTRWLVFRA